MLWTIQFCDRGVWRRLALTAYASEIRALAHAQLIEASTGEPTRVVVMPS